MYSFDARVRYSECDENGRLTLVGMVNYLQDCSTFHSESMGQGFERLRERGLAWILGGWQIEIDELPRFNTPIAVSTWCYDLSRTQALRCFQICDGEGRSLVRADSQWFMYDFGRGRAVRIPDDQAVYLTDEPRVDVAPLERKLKPQGEPRGAAPIVVGEQNLDTSRHVNNAQYILFALAALSELGEEARTSRVTVLYRKMAWLGDVVLPHVYDEADAWLVTLADEQGAVYATVKLAR